MATRTLALLLAWVSSYGKEVFTLGKNVNINPSPPVWIYSPQSQNVQSFDPSGST